MSGALGEPAAVTFSAQLAARNFDVTFTLKPGETLAVMGPNGAGKSTLLGLLAGIIRADAGSATLGDRTLFADTALFAGATRHSGPAFVPPHSRAISLLSQEALLFPHLSVLNNVAFGPRSAGHKAAAAKQIARRWLAAVGAADLSDRSPRQLSGGQAQRVAVARALASEPRLLLLDEPLAALDVAVAPALRRLLAEVLETRTAIIVTHDVLDALLLADRVIVLEGGRIVEEGPTREVFAHPRSVFSARLAGLNFVPGITTPKGLRTPGGHELSVPAAALAAGLPAALALRPAAISVSAHTSDSALPASALPASALPSSALPGSTTGLPAMIDFFEPRGDVVRVHCRAHGTDIPSADIPSADASSADTSSAGIPGQPSPSDWAIVADVSPATATELGRHGSTQVWLSWDPAESELYAMAQADCRREDCRSADLRCAFP